jgi:hypothetical protein
MMTLSGCAAWSEGQRATVLYNYPHAGGETLALTSEEHQHRISEISARDSRALVEDLELLFLTDRPTRLTRWHSR